MRQNKRAFLAGPFKSLVNPETGRMEEHEKNKLLNLTAFLKTKDYSVHNAHKREDWGKNFMTPEECTKIDFAEISACDLFIGFPGLPASPGTHIEIGWASALDKKIILLLEEGKDYAFLVRGLHTVANVTYIYYRKEEDYLTKLEEMCL